MGYRACTCTNTLRALVTIRLRDDRVPVPGPVPLPSQYVYTLPSSFFPPLPFFCLAGFIKNFIVYYFLMVWYMYQIRVAVHCTYKIPGCEVTLWLPQGIRVLTYLVVLYFCALHHSGDAMIRLEEFSRLAPHLPFSVPSLGRWLQMEKAPQYHSSVTSWQSPPCLGYERQGLTYSDDRNDRIKSGKGEERRNTLWLVPTFCRTSQQVDWHWVIDIDSDTGCRLYSVGCIL